MADSGVRVEGLRETVRSLERMGVEVSDLKAAFKKIGTVVANDAKNLTPVLTGRLAASIRPSNTKNKAVIRAGGARIPYAGVQEYGHYNNIEPHNFMRGAVAANQKSAVKALDDELNRLIRKLDLN